MRKRMASVIGQIKKIIAGKEWQVLIVNQYGKIIRIPRFQWYVVLAAVVTITALTTAAGLSFLLVRAKGDNMALKASMTVANERIIKLVDEKDLLLARLVIMRNILEEENPEAVAGIFKNSPRVDRQADGEGSDAAVTQEPDSPPLSDDMTAQDTLPAAVDVRQLSVTREPGDSLLSIKFQIHNVGEASEENVSGRIFVVLEEAPGLEEGRLVVPAVRLNDGIPARIDRGDYFSIARFKPVTLTARAVNPEKLTRAVVFVFSSVGELIYQSEFEIEVTTAPAVE